VRTGLSSSQFLVLVLALMMGTISSVCLKAPRAPTWDTQINLPLQDNTYQLMDLLDRRYFSVGPDSVLQFFAAVKIDTIRPISRIHLSPNPVASAFGLADFVLTGKYTGRITLALQDLMNEPLPEQPTPMPIPAFAFTVQRVIGINGIRQAVVLRGIAEASVANYSNVEFESLGVACDLTTLSFAAVEPQSQQTHRQVLDGGSLAADNEVAIAGSSRGSNGRPVLVSCRDSLAIEFQLDSLRLASAELQVPAANAGRKVFMGVTASNSFTLDSVTFAQGWSELVFQNGFPFAVTADYTIAELGRHGDLSLPPFGAETVEIDLAGRSLSNSGLRNALLTIDLHVATIASGDYVTIDKRQALSLNSTIQEIVPSYIAGVLGLPLYVTSPRETLPGLLPKGFSSVRLPRCRLDLKVASGIRFHTHLNLHIVARNQAGDSALIDRELQVEPGSPNDPRVAEFHVPLAGILDIGPDQLSVSYDIGIWGRGEVETGSFACGNASVSTPLNLALAHDTIDMGSRIVAIDQSTRDKIARYLVAGQVCAEVENHFPLGMNACVVLTQVPESQDSGSGLDGPGTDSSQGAADAVALPFEIPAGVVDQNQVCRHSSDTTVAGEVDESQLGIFHNSRIAAHLLLYVPDTDTVEIRGEDFVRIRSRAVLRLRVGGTP
jgi:hypothetical protein